MAYKKIQIGFDEHALGTLTWIRKKTGAPTIAEVMRDALGIYEWALEQRELGFTVGAFKDGVPAKEMVLPRRMKGVR